MAVIKKTGGFGKTLFEAKSCCGGQEGLRVERPLGGDYVVEASDGFHSSVEFDKKAAYFEENVVVYFISNGSTPCKGYTSLKSRDVRYDDSIVDLTVTYDYELSCAIERAENFVRFVKSHNIPNAAYGDKYGDIVNKYIQLVVKQILGKELTESSIEDVESNVGNLSETIEKELNMHTKLYDWGLIVQNFAFNINDDYMHRQEKKRVEHNMALKKRR